jgi:hypothetical protein
MMFNLLFIMLLHATQDPIDYESIRESYKCACESPASSGVERLLYTEDVGGSNPSLGTNSGG